MKTVGILNGIKTKCNLSIKMIFFFAFLVGCGSSSPRSSRDQDPVNPENQNRKPKEYLFGLGGISPEVKTIFPIVEEKVSLENTFFTSESFEGRKNISQSYGAEFAAFIKEFTNRAMSLKSLSPGRDFKVSMIENSSRNAELRGASHMVIYSGTVLKSSDVELLNVICHEMAHATKNHTSKLLNLVDTMTKASEISSEYFDLTYDKEKGLYTHSLELYNTYLAKWDALVGPISSVKKRLESEADLVGAMICGHFGIGVLDYGIHLKRFLELSPEINVRALTSQIKDGAQTSSDIEEVSSLLFHLDSHPTYNERYAQIKRLEMDLKVDEKFIEKSVLDFFSNNVKEKKASFKAARDRSKFGVAFALQSNLKQDLQNNVDQLRVYDKDQEEVVDQHAHHVVFEDPGTGLQSILPVPKKEGLFAPFGPCHH